MQAAELVEVPNQDSSGLAFSDSKHPLCNGALEQDAETYSCSREMQQTGGTADLEMLCPVCELNILLCQNNILNANLIY